MELPPLRRLCRPAQMARTSLQSKKFLQGARGQPEFIASGISPLLAFAQQQCQGLKIRLGRDLTPRFGIERPAAGPAIGTLLLPPGLKTEKFILALQLVLTQDIEYFRAVASGIEPRQDRLRRTISAAVIKALSAP